MRPGHRLALLGCLTTLLVIASCTDPAHAPATPPSTSPDRGHATVAGVTATAAPTIAPASAYPTGVPGALMFLQSYENDLIGGRYEGAWAMLAPGYRADLGDVATFASERATFMAAAGKSYDATANPTDVRPLADLLKGKTFAGSIVAGRAIVLRVIWTSLPKDASATELWVVNPAPGPGWELYRIS